MKTSSLFYKFFPVPEYMEMRAAGFDLSEVSLRFAELVPRGGELDLGDYGEIPVPPGTISLGRIQNADVLRELLRKAKKEHRIKFVRLSLPESYAYHVEMEIAKVKKKELRESIELQLEEYVPLKVSEVFFDYEIAEAPKQRPGVLVAVVSVIPKDVVLSYAEVFASAGLTLVSVDADANALARAVIPEGDPGTFMIIDMGRVKTGVYVVSRGLVRFASDIETGANAGRGAVVPSDLSEEINRHFVYWHAEKDKNGAPKEKIEKIILAGAESGLSGFRDYLSRALFVPVEMANIWTNVFSFDDRIPELDYRDSLRFGTAIGLALAVKHK